MKKILSYILFLSLFLPLPLDELSRSLSSSVHAQSRKKNIRKKQNKRRPKRKSKRSSRRRSRKANIKRVRKNRAEERLAKALEMAKQGKFEEASVELFDMSRSILFRNKKMQIKYVLGLMLYEMKLYQTAAFQFSEVVRHGKNEYIKQSLEKLSLAADTLNDDTMLNYALSKVKIRSFPRIHRDKLRYRIGEIQLRSGQFKRAAETLNRVPQSSAWYPQAKYLQGLAYTEAGYLKSATRSFLSLVNSRSTQPITDSSRVAGLLGLARVSYQRKDWDNAIKYYRKIPRDTEPWHDALFELSWAQMRSAQFRSVLSNFHSLHSPYYEEFYLPESLLLRGIVYLYICQYDEMEKTLNLFERIYFPVKSKLLKYLKYANNSSSIYRDFDKFMIQYDSGKPKEEIQTAIPYIVARDVAKEGDLRSSRKYINMLNIENNRISKMSANWRRSGIGKYSNKLVNTRLRNAKKKAGKQVLAHLRRIRKELAELSEQQGFAKYEMINGKKQALKLKIAGKGLKSSTVDEENDRDFYVQNGYEYWPFQGEYWLDEIGNYYYLGTKSCK